MRAGAVVVSSEYVRYSKTQNSKRQVSTNTMTLDELLKTYTDLSSRAADLRRGL